MFPGSFEFFLIHKHSYPYTGQVTSVLSPSFTRNIQARVYMQVKKKQQLRSTSKENYDEAEQKLLVVNAGWCDGFFSAP